MEEIWKDIEGYEGSYQVSNYGRVKCLTRLRGKIVKRRAYEKILKLDPYTPYLSTRLTDSKTGIAKKFLVHRLVAKAFIPNPNNYPFINHKDLNKINNHVSNLEWCTAKENMKHAHLNGCFQNLPRGEKHHKAKLTEEAVYHIRRKEMTQEKYAELYGVSDGLICYIQQRKLWKHLKQQAS